MTAVPKELLELGRALTPHERRHLFRRGVGKGVSGYAAAPGTGPAGETCKSCAHYAHVQPGVRKFRKCGLVEHIWTRGPGTDILARSPACIRWEKPKQEVNND